MRLSRSSLLCCCVTALLASAAVLVYAQTRKAGLWEMTTTMTLQQSPFPPGMPAPPNSPFSGEPRVTQVCLTQEMIDKYGAPVPARNDCTIQNVEKSEHGIKGNLVCSGRMNGKGDLHSEWTDSEHATGGVHFTGTVQTRAGERPIEWTSKSISVFKSADCGDVKPVSIPDSK